VPTSKGCEENVRIREGGRKCKEEGRERRWREGFGPAKNFGVAPSMPNTQAATDI